MAQISPGRAASLEDAITYQPVQLPTYPAFAGSTTFRNGVRVAGLAGVDAALQTWPPPGAAVGSPLRTAMLRQIAIACSGFLDQPTQGPGGMGGQREIPQVRAVVTSLRENAVKLYKYEVHQANKGNAPVTNPKQLAPGYRHEAPEVYNPVSAQQQTWRKNVGGVQQWVTAIPRTQRYKVQTTGSTVRDWMDANDQDPLVQGKSFSTLSYDEYSRIEQRIRATDPNVGILKQYSKQFRIDHRMLIPEPDAADGNRVKFFFDFDTRFDTHDGGRWQLFNRPESDAPLQTVQIYIYAMDRYGNLYAQTPGAAGLHHSSFLRGKEVICAGQIVCNQGRLVLIDNASGHYKPTPANLREAVQVLINQGFDFASGQIEVDAYEPNPLHGRAAPQNNFQSLQALGAVQQWGHANNLPLGTWERVFSPSRASSARIPPNTWNNAFYQWPTIRRVYGSANPNCNVRADYTGASFAANASAEPVLLEFTQLI